MGLSFNNCDGAVTGASSTVPSAHGSDSESLTARRVFWAASTVAAGADLFPARVIRGPRMYCRCVWMAAPAQHRLF